MSKKIIRSLVATLLFFSLIQPASSPALTIKQREIWVDKGSATNSRRFNAQHIDCLTKNIYYEAASEPWEGKVAVAQVTLNRVKSGKFPSDVCQVIYQKVQSVCQFSWYCEKDIIKKPINIKAYVESMEVAKQVLLDNVRVRSVKASLFYHADYIDPKWGKQPVTKIGRHVFYE
jgi:spore germination cell wall hydrolase CwlJ-like protein